MSTPQGPSVFWKQLCLHMNGTALGPTLEGLAAAGILHELRDRGEVQADPIDAAAGRIHFAMHILAMQALVERIGPARFRLTPRGRSMITNSDFMGAADLCNTARSLVDAAESPALPPRQVDILPSGAADSLFHLRVGPLAVALAVHLLRAVETGEISVGATLAPLTRRIAAPLRRPAIELLVHLGWARGAPEPQLTPQGGLLASIGTAYLFAASYLPLFARIPEILTGRQSIDFPRTAEGSETHLDRRLDIAFSGHVYRKGCRTAFLDLVLPLFDQPDLGAQPKAVVDTGSGDGSLLEDLYNQVQIRTLRGKNLGNYPLLMIGAEFNDDARTATATRLAQAGIPHQTLFGDIGDPAGINRQLHQRGYSKNDLLHVSKSIFHNRTFEIPHETSPSPPLSQGVFLDRNTRLISPTSVQANLIETLARWHAETGRHGLVIIESHIVPEQNIARAPNWNIMTCVESAHILSRQLLVEADIFENACREARFSRKALTRLDPQQTGTPTMTLRHLQTS